METTEREKEPWQREREKEERRTERVETKTTKSPIVLALGRVKAWARGGPEGQGRVRKELGAKMSFSRRLPVTYTRHICRIRCTIQ